MKKLVTLIFVLIAFNSIVMAQSSGGPDGWGYIWRDSNDSIGPVYNWIDIVGLPSATEVKSLADDNTAGPFPIGFNFHYYWYDRTTFRIGSNGYIIFNNGADAAPFPGIPVDTGGIVNGVSIPNPQDYIAAMASDITFVDGSGNGVPNADCWYYTTPGNDSLIISWINVPFWDGIAPGNYLGANTFQAILSNVDSSITIQFQTQNGVYQNLVDFMTVGIENISGTLGLQHSHDVYPPVNYAVKFYYPPNPTFVVLDVATNYNNNESTGGLFISKDGPPFVMTTEIENTGNQAVNPFNVTSQVINSAFAVVATSTVLSDTLQPAQTQFITHVPTLTTAFAGVYTMITNTQLANDLVSSNNFKKLEIRILDTTQTSLTLQYENAPQSSAQGLSWTGGNGGAGYYFIPPYYPIEVDTLQAYIVSNINGANFFMELYDDDGPFDSPGTRLDSVNVFNPQPITPGSWFSLALANPITITSGGFYVSWNMDGDNITLGTDQIGPFSNRTFEVLGSTWAVYRYRETQDLMIRVVISPPSGVGVTEPVKAVTSFSDFYPNPANDLVSVKFTMPDGIQKVTYSLYDMQGKLISADQLELNGLAQGVITIATSNLEPGMYNCKFLLDGQMLNRRFLVTR